MLRFQLLLCHSTSNVYSSLNLIAFVFLIDCLSLRYFFLPFTWFLDVVAKIPISFVLLVRSAWDFNFIVFLVKPTCIDIYLCLFFLLVTIILLRRSLISGGVAASIFFFVNFLVCSFWYVFYVFNYFLRDSSYILRWFFIYFLRYFFVCLRMSSFILR